MQIVIGFVPGFHVARRRRSLSGLQATCPAPTSWSAWLRSGVLADEHGLLHFDVAATFDDVPAPDVVVIPGGQITHRIGPRRSPRSSSGFEPCTAQTYVHDIGLHLRRVARSSGTSRRTACHHPVGVLRRVGRLRRHAHQDRVVDEGKT